MKQTGAQTGFCRWKQRSDAIDGSFVGMLYLDGQRGCNAVDLSIPKWDDGDGGWMGFCRFECK